MNENSREQVRYFFYLDGPPPTPPDPDGILQQWGWNGTEHPLSQNAISDSEQTQLLLYDIFIPLLGSLIIVLNLAVVTSSLLLLRKGQQPYTTYSFLGNVAASDLLTGFAVIYGQYAPTEIRGEDNCAILIGLIVATTIVSVYSVGLIAVDRYLYIMYGLHYQRYITPSRARLLIAATWFLGLIIGFLTAFGWRGDTDGGRVCWFVRLAPPALIILTTVLGIIPVIVVIVLYSIILHKALRRVVQLKKAGREQQGAQAGNLRLFRGGGGGTTASNANLAAEQPLAEEHPKPTKCFRCCGKRPPKTTTAPSKHPTKWRAIKVVMLTTGCFTVTWLPYFIASTMFVLCDPERNAELCRGLQFAIASPLAILGFTNSLLNPFIYAWFNGGFRTSMKKLWRKMCCRQRNNNKSSSQNRTAATGSNGGSESGGGSGQQTRNSDATTTTTSTSVAESPTYRITYNNRSVATYSNTSDPENQITDTGIDRPEQTRL